ncbi:DUF6789 family protein [Pseudomonas sp. N040]|uniref:DUF6789 family protein n=1 Tax=Pseudomonas sp. N040 TaxID=2785325 RepID=UPI0018A28C14|nr:DUF6789 family protein [Pseudomonas sp. N040]MBF7731254.1 hypothetical protein [Pseudomonas sp. N040]MBW7014897.1 hypothetical protein [Pseudomonas sp. N040]
MFSQFLKDLADKKEPLMVGAICGMIIITLATTHRVPNLLGTPLQPPLMVNLMLGLPETSLVGWAAHLLVGLVIFPLGYMLLAYRYLPGPALLKGVLYSLLLGTLAGVAAPLTDNRMFMGSAEGALTLYLLHAAYCCLIALIVGSPQEARQRDPARSAATSAAHGSR